VNSEMCRKVCNCAVCTYGRTIRDLINRTPAEEDKRLIEALYDRLIHSEDDCDYYEILTRGYRKKHGPMSFSEACELEGEEPRR
jgi:hypothetical protein